MDGIDFYILLQLGNFLIDIKSHSNFYLTLNKVIKLYMNVKKF